MGVDHLSLSIGAVRVASLCGDLEFSCNEGKCSNPRIRTKEIGFVLNRTLELLSSPNRMDVRRNSV